jgi:branched-chain amino acid transport system permease protein
MTRVRAAGAAVTPLLVLFAFACVMHVQAPSDLPGLTPRIEVLALGVMRGLTLTLLAVGIALVYRTNRIINFAQSNLGQVPGVFALSLIVGKGWSYWLAFPTGLAAALLLGVLVEFLLVRRFFASPRLILTVATVGIAQLLAGFSVFIPRWLGVSSGDATNFKEPFGLSFSIGNQLFDGHDVMVLITVPLALVSLGVFLRYTTLGIALRGAAESADRASLLGIPVKLLQSVVWMIATVLAFLTFFLSAGTSGTPAGVSIELLLTALGAVVIGRLDRLPTIVAAAIGFGIVDQAVKFDWGEDAYRAAALAFVIIVAVLFVRERRGSRVAAGAISTWQSVEEIRGVPRELRREPAIVAARIGFGLLAALAVVAVPFVWDGADQLRIESFIGIYAIAGVSMVVLSGWAGHVSLGQLAIVGLGGVAGASMTTLNDQDLVVGLLVGGLTGALVMIVVGVPALRAKGISLGISTLALSLATYRYLLNPNFAPGFIADRLPTFEGYYFEHRPDLLWSINVDDERTYYFVIIACLLLSIGAARGIRRSRTGRAIISVRENERAGQGFGVPSRLTFVTALATSGFIAGVAGSLFVHQQKALDLSNFEPADGLTLFAIAVVGGLGSIGGAIIGSIYVLGAQYFLPDEWWLLSQGIGLLLILMFFPGGLGAMLARVRDFGLRWYANRRGIRVPSLIADTRVDDFVATEAMVEAVAEATDATEDEIEMLR